MVPGDCFGQQSLIQSKPFLVTYKCVEPSQVAVLSREAYQRIVDKALKKDYHNRT